MFPYNSVSKLKRANFMQIFVCAGQFHSIGARYEQDGSYPDQKEAADEGTTFQYVEVF